MTILQTYPITISPSITYELSSKASLSLPKRKHLKPWPIYIYLDRANKSEIAPGLKTKILGVVVQEESLNDPLRSKTGDYINILPRIFSA